MNKLGVHKRWSKKFLLKEITCRVPEHAGLTSEREAESLEWHATNAAKVEAYAINEPAIELRDVMSSLQLHGLHLLRRAQYEIYKHGNADRSQMVQAAWHETLHMLLGLGRGAAQGKPRWAPSLRNVAEAIAMAYALGWNAAGDKIAQWAAMFMPQGILWSKEDWDARWEKKREPFARFTWALWADFANITLPPMPPHPYESPAFDALLACWRNPDPQALVEPLLDVCDWHTHECMYSRSMLPSKKVDFINDTLMGWPVEVHMVYRLRERLGLSLPPELDHPLMRAPLGSYPAPQPIPRDERLERVVRRACTEVPGLEGLLREAYGGANAMGEGR
jgi:hypothetical protein